MTASTFIGCRFEHFGVAAARILGADKQLCAAWKQSNVNAVLEGPLVEPAQWGASHISPVGATSTPRQCANMVV